MPQLGLEEFIERRMGDRSPVSTNGWSCESLPFGHDADYVENVDIPHPSVNIKPLFGAGTFTYYPGFVEISAFNITLYEDHSMRTTKWLYYWLSRIRNPSTGAYYLPPNYKRDLNFTLYNTKGEPILNVAAKNCWVSTADNWSLVPGEGEVLKLSVNIATDGLELTQP